ncbi:hypothetical protein ACIG47_03505 [Promicromonospora sp. NPDC052451]|uniref:hypothetical protein n=1 Tax=Promicromonospora sp. NPDC052451 TaxID=3364407 RepID=UPI0037C651F9
MNPSETPATVPGERRRPERRRPAARRVAAAGLAAAVGGALLVPVLDAPGASAHSHTELCSQLVEQSEEYIYEEFPEEGAAPADTDEEPYTFEAEVDEILGTLEEPTRAYLDQVTDGWADEPVGSERNMAWHYKTYLASEPANPLTWDQWSGQYVSVARDQSRGLAYERYALSQVFPLDTADWLCRDLSLQQGSTTSAVNRTTRQFINVSPGNTISEARLESNRALTSAGYKAHHVFGSQPSAAVQEQLRGARTTWSVQRASGVQTNQTPPSGNNPFNPPCRTRQTCPSPRGGAVNNMARWSGSTAREALSMRTASNQILGNTPRGFRTSFPLGGIDWTSLELRYVSENPGTDGFDYAFSAAQMPEGSDPSYGGEATLDLSSDALFTWLALDRDQFWVNLNPDQPETIIDEQFARTEAGRVLLESDFELKSTLYGHMDPETDSGAEFFESLEPGPEGHLCWGSWRMWVEPLPASVREDGDQLYILDAPLRVQMEPFDVSAPPGGGPTCEDVVPQDVMDRNLQRLIDDMVPLIEQDVNGAPEYADLRRVYTARIAAEWLRQRDAVRPGAFHEIIGSKDVSAWPVREGWDPQDVYDEFLQARQTVQFRYEYEFGDQPFYMDVTGGIEFRDTPRDPVSAARFEREHPTLPRTVTSARHEAVADRDVAPDEEPAAWLGGGTLPEPEGPEPTPTPDPSDGGAGTPGPDAPGTDRPDEPAPDPDRPAEQPTDPPADPPADQAGGTDDGELAATGLSSLWAVWVALALLLAGGALIVARGRLRPDRSGPAAHARRG